MENNQKQHLVKLLVKKSAAFNFKHPIQRGEEQWSLEQKSKLIDSILREYVVDPARVVVTMADDSGEVIKDENGKDIDFNIVMDGKQRITTLISFLNDGFKLSKHIAGVDVPPVIIDGKEYDMANYVGLTYSELPEEIQNKICEFPFSVNYLKGVTEWDLREMFKRQNGGKTLTKAQMNSVKISQELFEGIRRILEDSGCVLTYSRINKKGEEVIKEKEVENFWKRFLGASTLKNGEDRNLVLSTMMFVSNYNDMNFSLLNEDIERFIEWFDTQETEFKESIINKVIEAAAYINQSLGYGEKIKNLKKTSIPMFVANMAMIEGEEKQKVYMDRVKEYFGDYENHPEYKALVGSASASMENVMGRWEIFKGFAN